MAYRLKTAVTTSALHQNVNHPLQGADTFPEGATSLTHRPLIMGIVRQLADFAGREVDIAEHVHLKWHKDIFDGERQISWKGVSVYGGWFNVFWKWED